MAPRQEFITVLEREKRRESRRPRWGCPGAALVLAFDSGQPAIIEIVSTHILKSAVLPAFVIDFTLNFTLTSHIISLNLHAILRGRPLLPTCSSWGNGGIERLSRLTPGPRPMGCRAGPEPWHAESHRWGHRTQREVRLCLRTEGLSALPTSGKLIVCSDEEKRSRRIGVVFGGGEGGRSSRATPWCTAGVVQRQGVSGSLSKYSGVGEFSGWSQEDWVRTPACCFCFSSCVTLENPFNFAELAYLFPRNPKKKTKNKNHVFPRITEKVKGGMN